MPKRWSTVRPGPWLARTVRDEWLTVAALLAGLLLRIAFILHHAQFGGDALVYSDLAHNLRLHHIFGFTEDAGIRPTLIRLPGYPLFLAACFALFGEGNFFAVLWVQVALDLCTCWLLSRLAQLLWGSATTPGAPPTTASSSWVGEAATTPGAPSTTASSSWVGEAATHPGAQPTTVSSSWVGEAATIAGAPSVPFHGTGGRPATNPGKNRAATLTLWISCLCPFTANYAAVPITECLTLFCTTLAFYAFARWIAAQTVRHGSPDSFEGAGLVAHGFSHGSPRHREAKKTGASAPEGTPVRLWPILLGLALASAILLRPDRALLAAAVLPVMLWVCLRNPPRSFAFAVRSLLPLATAAAILLLPLAFWTLRNERVFHVFQPLAPRYANDPGEAVPLGFQRWYRTWAIDFQSTVDTYWNYDGSHLSIDALPARAFDSPAQRAATQALFRTYNETTSSSPALDVGFAALARERIAAHPVRFYVLLPTARVLNMALRPRTELMAAPIDWWNFPSHPGASTLELAYALLNAAYLALAVLGLYCWSARNFAPMPPLATAMLAFIVMRLILLLTLDNSEPRYTLDLYPVVLLLAGLSLSTAKPAQMP